MTCGEGFIYNSANAASTCASTACDISGTQADKDACCVAQATCGDTDGAGAGTTAVSDSDCGAGLFYDSANVASTCASTACDISGTAADKAACCSEHSCAEITLTTGEEGDASNSDACTAKIVLTTSTDPSCDVKCEAGYTAAKVTGTIKCASDAAVDAATTGALTCTVSEGPSGPPPRHSA